MARTPTRRQLTTPPSTVQAGQQNINADATTPNQFPVVTAPWSGVSPPQMVSAPDHVDWHLIQDHELTALSSVETGTVQSLGFTALGGAIGLAANFIVALEKVTGDRQVILSTADIIGLSLFPAMTMMAILCLTLSGINRTRNQKLVAEIRRRRKTGVLD